MKTEKWINKTLELLAIERNAEINEAQENISCTNLKKCEESGNTLINMIIINQTNGLFGRILVTLTSGKKTFLSANKFTTGDIIQLNYIENSSENKEIKLPTGVVSSVNEKEIVVAFDDIQDLDMFSMNRSDRIRIDRLCNDKNYNKLVNALNKLNKTDSNLIAQKPIDFLFNNAFPSSCHIDFNSLNDNFFNKNLNDSQKNAIHFALSSMDVTLIHGPPGTGKTTTLVEFILQAVIKYKYNKILICAPSNIAVDNINLKLVDMLENCDKKSSKADNKTIQITRLGHPARLLPQVLEYCLDYKISRNQGTIEVIGGIREEINAIQKTIFGLDSKSNHNKKISKTRKNNNRHKLYKEFRDLRKEIRKREEKIVHEIINNSQVILATNTGADSKLLKSIEFDIVIIDEAAQAIEASCWIPILKGKKCVLAGDHCQLPPTVISKEAEKKGLGVTLFNRIINMEKEEGASSQRPSVVKMLDEQYRMNDTICQWASSAMYDNKLLSHKSVAKRKLFDLPNSFHDPAKLFGEHEISLVESSMLLIDTTGCDMEEQCDLDEATVSSTTSTKRRSKSNIGEALLVVAHIKRLTQLGINQNEIAVITPYNRQVELLKSYLTEDHPLLEIRSVDGFQGCEKEAVVLSLVRSNTSREVGFLADTRRINVAITRAKRHVAVICDCETVRSQPFLKDLIQYIEKNGEYRSAAEFSVDLYETDIVTKQHNIFDVEALLKSLKSTSFPDNNTEKKNSDKTNVPSLNPSKKIVINKQSPDIEKDNFPVDEVKLDKIIISKNNHRNLIGENDNNNDKNDNKDEKGENYEDDEDIYIDDDMNETNMTHNTFLAFDQAESSEEDDLPESSSINSTLNQLHRESQDRKKSKQSTRKIKPRKKKNEFSNAVDKKVEHFMVSDEVSYLEKEINKLKKCAFKSCRKKIDLMGVICQYCKEKYCYTHLLPEIHGCGDDTRADVRKKAVHTYIKNGIIQKKESVASSLGYKTNMSQDSLDMNKKYLKSSLEKKILNSSQNRKKKKKSIN